MNNRITSIFCILILIFICIISNCFFYEHKNIVRYEQHLKDKNVSDYGSVDQNNLVSHLPLVAIYTNGQKIPGKSQYDKQGNFAYYEKGENGENEIKVDICIFNNEEAQNSIQNVPNIKSKAMINIRGKSSRAFDKSSYKISFIDDENNELKFNVLGMPAESEWIMNGPFLDKTLIRNYMWMNISANIMGYAPNVRFCECYIDDNYQGIYVMMESIKKGANRVNISSFHENDRVIPYIIKMDKQKDDNIENIDTFSYYTSHLDYSTGFSILYPTNRKLTADVKNYIKNDISSFEKAIYSYDFKNPKKGYPKYIDIGSWVDYYIIQEFLVNNDMCSFSTYMYKDKRGKLAMGPVWDFNNICDNYIEAEYRTEGFYFTTNRIWYEMLFKDKKFVNKVKKRYKELRKTYLSEEYLINYIDETIKYLGDAVNRNYEVWGYTFEKENQKSKKQYLQPINRNPSNYNEAIEKYKNFIIKRGRWLDSNLQILEQYSHTSKNKLYVE